jgi:hypothetical protein
VAIFATGRPSVRGSLLATWRPALGRSTSLAELDLRITAPVAARKAANAARQKPKD